MIEEVKDNFIVCSNHSKRKVSLHSLSGIKDFDSSGLHSYSIDDLISNLEHAKEQGKTEFVVNETKFVFQITAFKAMTDKERIEEQINEKELEIKALLDRLNG